MADSTNIPHLSSEPSHSSSEPKKRMVRGCTKMMKIAKVRKTGVKLKIEFDPQTGNCYGENYAVFKSYASFLARSSCSILIDEWRLVPDDIKNSMWDDLKLHFDIKESDDPNKCDLKKKWLTLMGERWRGFKAQLTSDYINNPNPDRLPPYEMYPFIKEDVWEKFCESQNTSAFKEKSQKGRTNVAKNLHPHTLSRGGYDLLERKMIKEKSQELDALGELDCIPSPPSRHDKWKRARQKRGGEYISEATRLVAEKIDSLVEENEKGMQFFQGRDDILTKAIGTSEHGGRVRGVGRFANLTNYFGRSSRRTQSIDVTEMEAQLEAKLEERLTAKIKAECKEEFEQQLSQAQEKMQQSFMETLKTMGLSEISPTDKQVDQNVFGHVSTKGSCSAAQENCKEDLTTDNVQRVLFMFLKEQSHVCLPLQHEPAVENFWISPKCIKEFLVGTAWLDCSILQVWCTYIHRLCIERSKSDVFGILDPVILSLGTNVSKSKKKVQTHLLSKLRDFNKVCYLAPYLAEGHWQLIIICPKDNTLVLLCSLHNDLHSPMKDIVTKAMEVYQMAQGKRIKPQWLHPKARLQPNGNDCGYYVMKNMLDIVSANITKSWIEVFNDPTELTKQELYDLRNSWATCFLDLLKP